MRTMVGKHRDSEASKKQVKLPTSHNNRESKSPDKSQKSENSLAMASTSKTPKEAKPHKSTEVSKKDTSPYNAVDDRRTSGPKPLSQSSKGLAFRGKGEGSIYSSSHKGLGFSFDGETSKDECSPPHVLLIVDLNSRNPTAAFNIPSLGYGHYKFLPALKAMSKTREAFLTSTKSSSSHSQSSLSSYNWTTDFLSHCRALLRSELGRPLEDFLLEITFTARGDASDRSKAKLLDAVKAAGFKLSTEDAVQVFPTVEAVAIEEVLRRVTKDAADSSTYLGEALKVDYNILVLHYDGDVAEIQSYSVSYTATTGKCLESQLRLEEIVYGETVDCGELVDRQFTQWVGNTFQNTGSSISADTISSDAKLMVEFAEVRRNYNPDQKDLYTLPLTKQSPLYKACYDSRRGVSQFQVKDSEIRSFFEPAMDSFLNSLDEHHALVSQKKKTIDEVIFAGAPCIAPYVENHLKDWGIGVGLLDTNIQAFVMNIGRYNRVEATPEIIVQGAIHGSYPGVEVVPRSRAHYGFRLSTRFEDGDPEWNRHADPWDNNIDKCDLRVKWQVRKDQLLDAHAIVTHGFRKKVIPDRGLRTSVQLYKCALDIPPLWIRTQQNVDNPDMQLVGSIAINFTEEDFPGGEGKVCDDGVYRRRLNFNTRILCGHYTRTLRITLTSFDGRRELGRAVFRYE